MAVKTPQGPIKTFDDWYVERTENSRTGLLESRAFDPRAEELYRDFLKYQSEMRSRVANYGKLEKLTSAEVLSVKPDLPNISSGETAGLVRRIARNVVQNTPNVEVISIHDDDTPYGVFSRHILLEKIIGSDTYSNDMQQNLYASTMSALTLGFDCVIPVLLQDAAGGWYVKYDSIHYEDVYPEPGAKDVRQANDVFIRRWLTKKTIEQIVRDQVQGWDIAALKVLLQSKPRQKEAASHQEKKHRTIPHGYEIVTWYSNTGDPFLTFSVQTKQLLRVEKNKHPLKMHPVHFMVLEKDPQQPLGRSIVELILGRQEFQDLMLNGAMKLWYRNINPSIIGYGTVNAIPNLSPGKYTSISNPNARIETFEVNTQTLLQYGSISQQNLGAMVNMVGSADQQMAASAGGGMSATPQGVEAQEELVDITTNNYQKAIESFFSHYASYALTIYFQELKGVTSVTPSAEARIKLVRGGLDPELFTAEGKLEMDFKELAVEYFVRCIPGSLVEMEDEKQLRILNELFVPLSQAMPAIAAAENPEMLANSAMAMQYIIEKVIELSGSTHSQELVARLKEGVTPNLQNYEARADSLEEEISSYTGSIEEQMDTSTSAIKEMQEQISLITSTQQEILNALGVYNKGSNPETSNPQGAEATPVA